MMATTHDERTADVDDNNDDEDTRYHVLIEFAFHHVDFHMAELSSVLEMNGLLIDTPACQIEPLPNAVHVSDDGAPRPFVVLSLPRNSIFAPLHVAQVGRDDDDDDNKKNNNNNIGAIILARCTLVRSVLELWGSHVDLSRCAHATERWIRQDSIGRVMYQHQSTLAKSWKVSIHTLGATYTRDEHDGMRKHFSFLALPGPVHMNDPDNEFVLIREIELGQTGSPLYPRHGHDGNLIPANDGRPPLACYFGRTLGGPRLTKGRGQVEKYNLKKRLYLGPTSMDAELALIMTNLGQVGQHSFVMDPFVGTASILLTCALRGAVCFGTDIDVRILRGKKSTQITIWNDFANLDLPRPELVRSDNALYHRHYQTTNRPPLYDAIVTDPPYGIRAGARQSGSRQANPKAVLDVHRHNHIAQTRPYPVANVMADLLDMAARTLVMGGRLVYVIPSFNEFDPAVDLPQHACLVTTHVCYQALSAELGRRMVTMVKMREYNVTQRENYLASIWKNGPASAEKCANLRDKILEAAKQKPGYEQRAAVKRQKRKETREAGRRAKRETAAI